MGVNYNKGNNGINNANGRRRSYGTMLLLAFGAAFLGVMILHKLRERRIYNLIVKQKDQELFSLHLLYQKEKEYSQEVKRRYEEMKAKLYPLRNHKMELDRRLLEMQSTIDSLKDELKTMEVSFEEKQNEIRMLKVEQDHKASEKKNNHRVSVLIESLRQKEAEIEELKHRLVYPGNVWSVSSDNPSKPNSTAVNLAVALQQGNGDWREMIGQQVEKFRNEQDQSVNYSTNDETTSSSFSQEQRAANSTDESSHYGAKSIEGEKLNAGGYAELEMHENRMGEGDEDHGTTKGGMKSEIQDGSENGVWSMAKGKHGFVSNSKGKRWRLIAKNKRLDNNGKDSGSVRSYKEGRGGFKSRVKRAASKRVPLVGDDDIRLEGRKTESSSYAKSSENKIVSGIVEESQYQKAEIRKFKGDNTLAFDRIHRKEMSKYV